MEHGGAPPAWGHANAVLVNGGAQTIRPPSYCFVSTQEESPSRRPSPEGIKGRLEVRGVVREKNNVIGVQQNGDPGGSPGAKANTGAGSANSGSGAVDKDVEEEWGEDAALANAVSVLPRVRKGLGNTDSRAWAAIEVVQEEPETARDPSTVEAS